MSGVRVKKVQQYVGKIENEVLSEFREGQDFEAHMNKIGKAIDAINNELSGLNPGQPLDSQKEEVVEGQLDKIRNAIHSLREELGDLEHKVEMTEEHVGHVEKGLDKDRKH